MIEAPYRNLAVASALSPRFLPILAESRQLAAYFGTGLSVFHAGALPEARAALFEKAFRDLKLPAGTRLCSHEGAPVEVIGALSQANAIDLLIMGALDRDSEGRQFVGNVARMMMHTAKCSLFLLTHPTLHGSRFRRIVVVCDYSEGSKRALRDAIYLAERDEASTVVVLRVLTVFDLVRMEGISGDRRRAVDAEQEKLETFINEQVDTSVDITAECLECTTGFAVSDYATSSRTDLLVMPTAPAGSRTLFRPGLDWAESTVPTNLLLVRDVPPVE